MEADRKLTRGNPTEHNMISESPDLATLLRPLSACPEPRREAGAFPQLHFNHDQPRPPTLNLALPWL